MPNNNKNTSAGHSVQERAPVSLRTAARSQGSRPVDRWRAFLYRRFARWVTCEVSLAGGHRLALDSKYQLNSFQDVFCDPFYWQLYTFVSSPPRLVVDLGAHCGHFSMLADVCFRARFGTSETEYLLIEPNPRLLPVIARNLGRSALCSRNRVLHGLVGAARTGHGTLWVHAKNFLSASVERMAASHAVEVPYVDLEAAVGDQPIDLLKVDIQGAEFALVDNYPAVFGRVATLIIEIHAAPEFVQVKLRHDLRACGLQPIAEQDHGSYRLVVFQRAGPRQRGA
jgi:FkbM family methyltransferase